MPNNFDSFTKKMPGTIIGLNFFQMGAISENIHVITSLRIFYHHKRYSDFLKLKNITDGKVDLRGQLFISAVKSLYSYNVMFIAKLLRPHLSFNFDTAGARERKRKLALVCIYHSLTGQI
jgi:hypothetical protein